MLIIINATETQANKFIPVAGLFFFPLLAKYDSTDPTFDLMVRM